MEKGDETDKVNPKPLPTTKLSAVAEKNGNGGAVKTTVARPVTGRPASKWGRLLGSASLDSSSEGTAQAPQGFTRSLSAKDSKERPSSSSSGSSSGQPAAGSGNKVFPKLQKVASTSSPGITRQDTIDEMVELDPPKNLSLRKMLSYDCGLRDPSTASMYQTPLPDPMAPPEYKELMTNLMDFKVDVKLEIQKLNQRMGKMEDLLSEIIRRLAPPESSSSSQSPQGDPEPNKKSSTITVERPTDLSTKCMEGSGLGPVILRKRRSKSRAKGAAPQVPTPLGSKVASPESQASSPTESTNMMEEVTPSSKKPIEYL